MMSLIDHCKNLIIDETHDAFIFLYANSSKIIYTSDSVKRILGYTANEIIDAGLQKFVVDEDKEKFETFYDNIRIQKLNNTCELRLMHKQGFIVWSKATSNFVAEDQAILSVIILREITGEKVLEHQLMQCQDNLMTLIMQGSQTQIPAAMEDVLNENLSIASLLTVTVNKINLPLVRLSKLLEQDNDYPNIENFKSALTTVHEQAKHIEKILIEINDLLISNKEKNIVYED